MTHTPLLTQERLKEILSYDPETGIWRWLTKRKRCRHKAGDIAGCPHHLGYWRVWIDGREYLSHIIAWLYMTGEWPNSDLDHEDTDRGNNRWTNLRKATTAQNRANCPAKIDNPHKIKGVSFVKGRNLKKPFRATMEIGGEFINIGYFITAKEAGAAYAAAAKKAWGEFAYKHEKDLCI